ncbi:MAG TPA: PleD family two-component system response regulator [Hyphomicrobiaceae bacterium]|nr:PleD family two-component system response regulator [Hyphomicrobiaceae bacterium]
MTGRVLVVDDIAANVKLLEARLSAEYFDVLTAHSGEQALAILRSQRVDVVLLDVMMPSMDGFEVCRRIKGSAQTMHVPVVMVTALDQAADKVQGLEAGADDFLAKPVDDIALVTRVRNLTRLKTLNDEMLLRMLTGAQIGGVPVASLARPAIDVPGRILLVEDDDTTARRIVSVLRDAHEVQVEPDVHAALLQLGHGSCDVLIVSLSLAAADGLRLCSQVRSLERTRHLPIVVIVPPGEEPRLLRALDMGVNDYLTRPVDRNELLARVRTQIKRKRHSDHLRGCLEESLELAVTDPLTGLHNRRYLETHLSVLADHAAATGRPISLVLVDIDNFKAINDTYGHAVGDSVLREFASRFRSNTRSEDLVCRIGGEEFVIVMPDSGLEAARQMGERLRVQIASEPFRAAPETSLNVTASVGVASHDGAQGPFAALFGRADQALYAAKRNGRNRVVADAA